MTTDTAYSSNMTSAAVDACLIGLPVVMLGEMELNFSPLRGQLRCALRQHARGTG